MRDRLSVPRLVLTLVAALACVNTVLAADAYPARAIKLVVGYSVGGPGDAVARFLAAKAAHGLGQPVVVENRPGAAGSIAAATVAKAAPDGYTLLYANSDLVIYPALRGAVGYDPIRDFAPVSGLSQRALVLVVHPGLGVKSIKQLVALAKAKPGQLHFGSSGVGSVEHLTAEAFKSATGIDLVHVPYKGSAPAMLDLVAGRIQLSFEVTLAVAPYLQKQQLLPLLATGRQRFQSLPGVPSVQEAGMPELESGLWSAILAPANTPQEIVERLNAEFRKARNAPETMSNPLFADATAFTATPAELQTHIKGELARYVRIIRQAGIKGD